MTKAPEPGAIVVGAGYAGAHAVRELRSRGVVTTLVDLDGNHDLVTRLAAIAGGTAPASDAAVPAAEWADSVVLGRATEIGDGSVVLADGRRLEAGAVVTTVGSAPSRPHVEGLELAHALRTPSDALSLRGRLERSDAVVVVGGGPTGVQLAGAISVARPSTTVHLVEGAARLLSGMPPALGRGAERILAGRGVQVRLGRDVDRIGDDEVDVGGACLRGLVVWAGGFAADASALGLPAVPDGRVAIDPDLRVRGMSRTFAAGDLAAHTDERGEPLPMSAQVAVAAGAAAGRNAALVLAGEPTRAARLSQIGWVLDLGGRRGVARVGPVDLALPVLDLVPPVLHDLIDLKDLVEVGGLAALRHAPASVRALLPPPLRAWSSTGCAGVADRRPGAPEPA